MTNYYIHESSIIDPGVRIGNGTKIWHFCHVMTDAEIGENCTLGQNIFVGRDVKIGNNCKIQNNVSVYEGVTLEDEVFCGPSCVFTNDNNPRSVYSKGGKFLPTTVRRGATIGANATIVCNTTIGRHAFIGAGSVVTKDVPDYGLVYGVPGELHGWTCECGSKLNFAGASAVCSECSLAFRQEAKNRIVRIDGDR